MIESDKGRYVIQRHSRSDNVHWDLMLEDKGRLITWQIPVDPDTLLNDVPENIEKIHDHDIRFLQYEGPVQNNTGTVKIADAGTYQVKSKTETGLLLIATSLKYSRIFSLELTKSANWQVRGKCD